MQYLDSIALQNFAMYESVRFDFKPGLHVVRGANGAGKSVVFGAAANLLYGTPPLATRAKQAKHYLPPSSQIALNWHNSSAWAATQSRHGASVRYSLSENGVALAPHRIADAQSAISAALPISANQWYTFVYINALRPSVLLAGSETDRRNFFEELFALHEYETIRAALQARAETAAAAADTYQYLQQELRQLRSVVWPSRLNQRCSAATRRHHQLQLEHRRLQKAVAASAQARALVEQLRFRLGIKRTSRHLASLQRQLVEATAAEAVWQAECVARATNATTDRARNRLQQQLAALPPATSQPARLRKLQQQLQRTELVAETRRRLQPVKQEAARCGLPKIRRSTAERSAATAQATRHSTQTVIKRLERISSQHSCPLCQQGLSAKYTKLLLQQQRRLGKTAAQQLRDATAELHRHHLAEQLANYPHDYSARRHKQLRRRVAAATRAESVVVQRKQLQQALRRLPEQHPTDQALVEPPVSSARIAGAIARLQADQRLYRRLQGDFGLAARHRRLQRAAQRVEQRLEQASATAQRWLGKQAEYKKYVARVQQLQRECSERARAAREGEVLKSLVAAYGPRGLKLQHMQHLLHSYEAQLNAAAGHIFRRGMRFAVETTGTGFKINATRNGATTDVNLLSGAESRAFSVLSWLALLPYVPANNRCNVGIFDETEANMSRATKDAFISNLLPVLREQVPCLILVTPQNSSEFYVPNAQEYTVVRQGSTSRLLEGAHV